MIRKSIEWLGMSRQQTQALNDFMKKVKIPDEEWTKFERYLVATWKAGLSRQKSTYLLCPAELLNALNEQFAFDICAPGVEKNCGLVIEREENGPLTFRIIYEFTRRRGF